MDKLDTSVQAIEQRQGLWNSTALNLRHRAKRPQQVLSKATLRQNSAKSKRRVSFVRLAKDPVYRRTAVAQCPETLAKEINRLGFETSAAVAACGTIGRLRSKTHEAAARDDLGNETLKDILVRARHEALRIDRLMRHRLAVLDPMNQGLRHTPSQLAVPHGSFSEGEDIQTFAKPASLQSNQSPGAYLRYLYRIATGLEPEIGILCAPDSPYALKNRRPDLSQLVLNEANLKQEIPTLNLVNEVLAAGLGDIDMRGTFHPIALPYDHATTTARAALSQIGGAQLNDVAVRSSRLEFETTEGHRWATDIAGLLGLVGTTDTSEDKSVLNLLSETHTGSAQGPSTLVGLYNVASRGEASTVDHLMSSLDLDFDGVAQLLGLYSVAQERGGQVPQNAFATAFLGNAEAISLAITRGPDGTETKSAVIAGEALPAPDLRALNYLARLHHGTGLAFHELNTILTIPGAATRAEVDGSDTTQASRRVTSVGLRLLASYPLYGNAFGLTPAGFAAFFDELSPYRRADQVVSSDGSVAGLEQTEISFLRSVFGDDAPDLQHAISAAETPISDIHLANVIARGLGLSALELERLVAALDGSFALTQGVDARGLGALYRLRTVCAMLGWPLLSGLSLIEQVSAQLGGDNTLLATLTARNTSEAETHALCDTLDWLVALSQWMSEATLSPEQLCDLLGQTPLDTNPEDDIAWLEDLAIAFSPLAVGDHVFQDFETWRLGQTDSTEIPAETWNGHLSDIDPVYRPNGVFLDAADRPAIDAACRSRLVAAGVDPDQDENASNLQTLVSRLDTLARKQAALTTAKVAALYPAVNVAGAEPLIRWAQTTPLDLLDALLRGQTDPQSQFWSSQIKRHIAIVTALKLGDVELWILAHRPEWLSPDLVDPTTAHSPLSLAQLYALQRFATVQVGAATDAAWRGYLALTQDGPAEDETTQDWTQGCRETLALLLGCPAEDANAYLDALWGSGSVATSVLEIDVLARHTRLAEDLGVSGTQLLDLKAVSDTNISGDWQAAAAAAQTGLARFDGGRQVSGFQMALAEHHRDALIAAFMQTKIASDDRLAAEVSDQEKLYAHLLLDVNVSSAVPTSRIIEATNALQLYILRALSGLEPDVAFTDRGALAEQWELDKDYRQWEANQKLELYPQNYIEPELRQILSPEFDTLLQALSGGDISPDSVEAAVNAYMNGLAGLCDLSLCSFFADQHVTENGAQHTKYHFLAKAKWEPGRFFYRTLDADFLTIAALNDPSQFLKAMDWNYWQEVSIPKTFELFSDVNVCVFKNRFFFFWIELEERRKQTMDGAQKTTWRLHPRYMRCDHNALTGAMLTPGLFLHGSDSPEQARSDDDTLLLDAAFEWSGSKPILNGTYHPTRAPDGLVYGKLQQMSFTSSGDTLCTSFGIDLPANQDDDTDQRNNAGPESKKTALHIRLSDDWSDAILEWGGSLVTFFQDNSPNGYVAIHPQPVSETQGVVDHYLADDPESYAGITGLYTDHFLPVVNRYGRDQNNWQMTYLASAIGEKTLGSIEIDLYLGERLYDLSGTTSATLVEARETSPTRVSVRYHLTYDNGHHIAQQKTTDWITRSSTEFNFAGNLNHKKSFNHPTNERFNLKLVLPEEWEFDLLELAHLTVRAEIKRDLPDFELTVSEFSSPGAVTGTVAPDKQVVTEMATLGTFKLRAPTGQHDSGWSQAGEHGNRNFLHLTEKPGRRLEETFVLLNSSSVLSKLAKSMPRPGGCESLFTLENHLDKEEDFGTFLQDYPETLDVLYQDDQTSLLPERVPGEKFDFDSAYGAYGWEVFYHIPAAVAAGYAASGQFDQALRWLQKIFDPHADSPWQVMPLLGAGAPPKDLGFDTGDVIIDPDRIARDHPFYYQQATIRNYLETLLEAGDAAYEQETQESLHRAKALYVSAKQLFSDNLSEVLESMTNTSWTNPKLGETAGDGYTGFLPPYNDELRGLHTTLEQRLHGLRHWLNLDGEPLDIPLLPAQIDPRELQRSAKAKLAPRNGDDDAEDGAIALLDFPYIVNSVKGYLNNLKLTSYRLQDASEKESESDMEEFRMDAAIRRAKRELDLHDFAFAAAEKDVQIKEAAVAGATLAMANHVAQILAKTVFAGKDTGDAVVSRVKSSTTLISSVATQVVGSVKSTIPNTFGFSNGGQNLEQSETIAASLKVSRFLYSQDATEKARKAKRSWGDVAEWTLKTGELANGLGTASLALQKAKIGLDQEEAMRDELDIRSTGAQGLRENWNGIFGGTSFYKPFREDLEALYADEWATTQALCRLLVDRYNDDTGQQNGFSFIRTTSLSGEIGKFNAPHRLAVDIERLETAYIKAMFDRMGDTCECSFALSELQTMGQDQTSLDALVTQGETYFDLTDEMFDVFYPGQYDRRIQSISIEFPDLDEANLSPHARLTQVSNTRYLTRDRAAAGRAKIRKNRHGLQGLTVSGCHVDTRSHQAPDGLLGRFQNTGTESSWHLVIPSLQELGQGKRGLGAHQVWRNSAQKRIALLREHISEVTFTVRFSGRWG